MTGATYVDRRARTRPAAPGLPLAAALVLALALAVLGHLVDAVTGHLLHAGAGGFVVGCGVAAWLVRRPALRAVAVSPPLLYVVLWLLPGMSGGGPRSLVGHAMALFTQLVVGAPVLVLGTLAALTVALLRGASGR